MKQKNKLMLKIIRQRELFFMIIPVMIYVFIFSYLPLKGWSMAFQYYRPQRDVQEWVGLGQFEFLFRDRSFIRIMTNTLGMSAINLVLGFSTAIFLALMMNEIKKTGFKRVVQTISYMPYFLSWVIAAALISDFLSSNGLLNVILQKIGVTDSPTIFLANKDSFWWIIGWGNVWKNVGWNTIIYLAAITGIDPQLYESAELDGAGRLRKMWHITLPGIKSTILVLVIMNIGWILNAGFEVQYLLANNLTIDKAETIDVFVIRYGLNLRNYSLATALGIFRTITSVILLVCANTLSKRWAKESLV
jgi:putative aldouronate transport system permease protein